MEILSAKSATCWRATSNLGQFPFAGRLGEFLPSCVFVWLHFCIMSAEITLKTRHFSQLTHGAELSCYATCRAFCRNTSQSTAPRSWITINIYDFTTHIPCQCAALQYKKNKANAAREFSERYWRLACQCSLKLYCFQRKHLTAVFTVLSTICDELQ